MPLVKQIPRSLNSYVGGLVGYVLRSAIRLSYSNAAVTATVAEVGGLAGTVSYSTIVASYATGSVTGDSSVGGLAGTVSDSTIVASYATGVLTGTTKVGGLLGEASGSTITNSYWDTTTSGQANSAGGGAGKTTSQLQTPVAYGSGSDIYADWNVNTDGVAGADDPWDFGTASQYPALKADFDGDGTPTAYEFGRQGRSAPLPVDYDADDDNLIDVNTLAQLNAMRWDLDGNGVSTNAGYTAAFPNPAAGMGCPATCTGYELTADLDFNTNTTTDVSGEAVIDSSDDYWNGGSGWEPIGADSSGARYNTVFAGNGHTISHLFINRSGSNDVGLFGATGAGSEVRMVGLVDANVTGQSYVGGLVGTGRGDIRFAYITGSVSTGGGFGYIGGLVGYYDAAGKAIAASYSTARVTTIYQNAGGLVGELFSGTVLASYATGAVTATENVGGLVGYNRGAVVGSYATGAVTGTTDVGGLVGYRSGSGSVTNSYWDTTTSGQANSAGGAGKTTSQLQSPTAYGSGGDIYANWNVDVDNADNDNDRTSGADDPWDFGTASQYPALKADFDGDGTPTAYEFGRQTRSAPAANSPPAFATATGSRSVAENTAAGADIGNPITAADPDVGETLTYSLGGLDANHFDIVAASGQLQTKGSLDYEAKDSYTVVVTATDGDGLTDTVTVTINVTDVDEPPLPPHQLNVVPDVGFFYFNWQPAPAADMVGIPPVTAYEVQYRKRISTGPDVWEDWTDHPNPVGPHYTSPTIRDLIPGQTYGMRVRAKNHEGESPWSLPVTGVPNPYANTAPSFTEGATATRSVAENTAGGQDIGNPVAAADVNAGDTLTYSLRGTDASHFQLDTATGQLQTKGALDYEGKASYQVIVRVTDGKDRNDANSNVIDDTITVTIEVTNVNEPPTAAPSNVGVASAPLGLEVTWTAPSAGAGRPPVSGYDVRYRALSGGVGAWQDHNHRGANARARIRGLTPGDTYGVEVRAKNGEGESDWSSTASGQAGAAPSGVDYDFDDDGLIEVDNLDQLDAIRYDPEGDGFVGVGGFVSVGVVVTAADKDAYDLAFPGPALGMGCPAVDHDDDASTPAQLICTGYELNQDLDFNTDTFTDNDDGAVIDSSDAYWNGGLGWDPIRFYGTFEGNRYTISNLFINRPDRDEVGLFSRLGFPYTWRNQIYRVGLVNVQITGGERVGALAGEAYAFIHDSYSSGSVSGAGIVGGLLGKLTVGSVIVSSYSDANVFGTLVDSSHAGGLVAWAGSDSIIYGSFATGQVSAPKANGGLVGSNFGNIIASYARGELDFGIGNQDPWDFDEPFKANGVGGLVGNNWGRVITSYSTGGHPLYMKVSPMAYPIKGSPYYNPRIRLPDRSDFSSEAEWEKAVRETYDGGENNYRADYFWHIGGLVGDSALGTEIYSYWDVDTSDHPVSGILDPEYLEWHRGEGLSTAELQSPTGYSGIYADWNVDIEGDGIADDLWDFGTGSQYPILKADWDGDGTATSQEFGSQETRSNRDVRATGAVADTPPGQPDAPGFIDIEETRFRITWTAPAAGSSAITGYGIQYKLTSAADSAYADVKPTPTGTGTGYNLVNQSGQTVTSGTSYDVRVRARNAAGWGPWSASAVAATAGGRQSRQVEQAPANQAPAFAAASATVSVAENTAANTNIGAPVRATDPDAGDTLTYTLGTTADDGHFAIDSATGQLQTQGSLNYEGKASYTVTVTATDGGGLSASIGVTIDVTNVNEAPAFAAASATVSVAENTAANTNIGSPVKAADPDGDTLTYTLGTTADDGHFAIDSATGQLQTQGALDYEGKASYSVTVTATDGGGLSASIDVTIDVTNVNEVPAFAAATATVSVAENTAANTNIGSPVKAADPDGDTLTYTLGTTADDGHFAIDSATGQLQTQGALDYEGKASYSVTVTATDGGGLSASIAVTITVTDVADTPPGQPSAPEIINLAQTSFRITWTAPAAGSSAITGYGIQYKLTSAEDSAYADVKPTPTGTVTGYNLKDRSGQTVAEGTSYAVRVRARTAEGWGAWSDAAEATTTGSVPAPANQAPAFAAATATVSVAENTAANTNIGSPVKAADPDGDTLTYTLGTTADDGHFAIDSATGQLRTKGALDYEGKSSYSVTVTATDGGGLSASIAVTINVTNVNEAPAFAAASVALTVAENTAANTNIGSPVKAADPDDGDTLIYTLGTTADDGHFAIDSASGQLQTKGALDYEGKASYSVTVTATDGGGLSASIQVTITVTDVADTPPGQPAAPEIINVKETSFRITWTAPAEGSSPITGYGIQYKLTSAEDSVYADVKPTPTGIGTGYNLVNRNGQTVAEGTSYAVRVRARNTEGWGPWSAAAFAATVGAAPAPINQAPAFAAATATVSVTENIAANTNIGSPVKAADPDGDTLTYTLGTTADDGHFAIDSATGQLQTQGALDYEGKSSYSVTVTATDGGGLSASIQVTITVTDVADTPPGQPAAPEIINVKETSFRITWTAPAEGSSPITGYGIQYKLTSAEDSVYADVKPTPTGIGTGYNVVDRSGQSVASGTSYTVRVRARNTEGWGPWSAAAIAVTAGAAESDEGGSESGDYQAQAFYVESQGRVILQWDEVSKADHYTIEKNGQLLPGKIRATSHYDDDVEKNTRYEYRITAYSGDGAVLATMTAATGD